MPFTTWIRDLFGIRKDVIDTKKAKLEITKLEDEEGERRGLIDVASLDDVKEYDPKTRRLVDKIKANAPRIIGGILGIVVGIAYLALVAKLDLIEFVHAVADRIAQLFR